MLIKILANDEIAKAVISQSEVINYMTDGKLNRKICADLLAECSENPFNLIDFIMLNISRHKLSDYLSEHYSYAEIVTLLRDLAHLNCNLSLSRTVDIFFDLICHFKHTSVDTLILPSNLRELANPEHVLDKNIKFVDIPKHRSRNNTFVDLSDFDSAAEFTAYITKRTTAQISISKLKICVSSKCFFRDMSNLELIELLTPISRTVAILDFTLRNAADCIILRIFENLRVLNVTAKSSMNIESFAFLPPSIIELYMCNLRVSSYSSNDTIEHLDNLEFLSIDSVSCGKMPARSLKILSVKTCTLTVSLTHLYQLKQLQLSSVCYLGAFPFSLEKLYIYPNPSILADRCFENLPNLRDLVTNRGIPTVCLLEMTKLERLTALSGIVEFVPESVKYLYYRYGSSTLELSPCLIMTDAKHRTEIFEKSVTWQHSRWKHPDGVVA